MKKNVFYCLFAALFAVTMVACGDDDEPNASSAAEQVAGTYATNLDITLNGTIPVATDLEKNVAIEAVGDNAIKMTLSDFGIEFGGAEIKLGNLSVENCALRETSEGVYSFTGSEVLEDLDVFADGNPVDCTVTIENGTIDADKLEMNLGVTLEGMNGMTVQVNCNGTKQ